MTARIKGLDGLRAVAILAVLLWHAGGGMGVPTDHLGWLTPVVNLGWAGVDLFFALSGFLITSLLLDEERASAALTGAPRFSLRAFYARRTLRILPLFYLVFAFNVLVLAPWPLGTSVAYPAALHGAPPAGVLPYATFWGNYVQSYGWRLGWQGASPGSAILVYWSLCVEEHFYLLWPGLLALARSRRARVGVALAVCVACCALRAVGSLAWGEPAPAIHTATHYRLDALLWGALGALAGRELLADARVRRGLLVALGLACAAFAATGNLTALPPGTALGHSLGLTLLDALCAVVVLEVAMTPRGAVTRALEAGPLRALGVLSYAMYLVHFQAMDVGRVLLAATPREPTPGGFALAYAAALAFTVLAAIPLHLLVERPIARLRRRLAPSA